MTVTRVLSRRGWQAITGTVAVVAATWVSAPRPRASAADRPVPFQVGEVLTYDVGWSNVLTAGTIVMSVKERRDLGKGRAGYYCLAELKPSWLIDAIYPLYYKADTVFDTATLQPVWAAIYSAERGRVENRLTRFTSASKIEYEELTAKTGPKTRSVPRSTLDALSAVYALRAQPLKGGSAVSLSITDEGKVLRLLAPVVARESLKTAIGTLPAWRLTPQLTDEKGAPATARDVTLWVSDDARRVPLRVEASLAIGRVTLTIVSVR